MSIVYLSLSLVVHSRIVFHNEEFSIETENTVVTFKVRNYAVELAKVTQMDY